MPLRKVAPTNQWQSAAKGGTPSTLVIAYDAAADQYYVAAGEAAAAYLVHNSDDDQFTIDTVRGTRTARIVQAGGAPGRIIE